jgi:hypothetical protein
MTTQRISGTEIQAADIIHFLGHDHLIVSTDERNGFGDRIARAANGWGIALEETRLDVSR